MKKKILIGVGLACLTAGIGLAGCGGSTTQPETTTAETTAVETTTANGTETTTATELSSADKEKQFEEMKEKLHAFDEAHPEYKDLWYDIINTYHTVYYKNLSQAFANMKAGKEEAPEPALPENVEAPKAEDKEKLDKIMNDMTILINKSFESNVSKVFDVFDSLAKDGEFSFNEGSDPKKTDTETSADLEAQMQEVLKEYEAFKKEHPDFEKMESEGANKANENIYSELKKAQESSKDEVKKEIDALFDKYNVPENDRTEIAEMLTTMVQQINADFEESVKSNDALGPIIFGGQE